VIQQIASHCNDSVDRSAVQKMVQRCKKVHKLRNERYSCKLMRRHTRKQRRVSTIQMATNPLSAPLLPFSPPLSICLSLSSCVPCRCRRGISFCLLSSSLDTRHSFQTLDSERQQTLCSRHPALPPAPTAAHTRGIGGREGTPE